MSATYSLRLMNPLGEVMIDSLVFSSVQLGLKENERGRSTVNMPLEYLDGLSPSRDWLMEVWRSPEGGTPMLVGNTVWLVRRNQTLLEGGSRGTRLQAFDAKEILRRRIIAYAAGTPYVEKEAPADDVMKAFVRENLGSLAVDTDRAIPNFTVAADTSAGPIVRIDGTRKNLLKLLQDISNDAEEAGTYVSFDMIWDANAQTFLFETFTGQRGVDRSSTSDDPLIVSLAPLDDVDLDDNWENESNFVYAIGRGSGLAIPVKTASDALSIGASPYGRIELLHNAGNAAQEDALQGEADLALRKALARTRFSARLIDGAGLLLGLDFNYGDRLIAQLDLGNVVRSFDCRLSALGLQVSGGDQSTSERVDLVLESE